MTAQFWNGDAAATIERIGKIPGTRHDLLPKARFIVAIAAMLMLFIGLHPFSDNSTTAAMEIVSGQETLTYLLLFTLVAAGLILLPIGATRALRVMLRPVNLFIMGWLVVAVMVAPDHFTSLKRLLLSTAVLALAATIPLLMRDTRALARAFLVAAGVVIALSYLGVLLAPDLAIHQARDVVEPHLAGAWRGIYGHKNATAAVMASFVIAGVLIARTGMVVWGIAIAFLAFVFLVASHGKSAFGLIVVAFGLAWAVANRRSLAGKFAVGLLPLLLLNILSVGSVVSDVAKAILEKLPIDATFTGRSEIWEFALASIADRPLTGYGYQAFWNSEIVRGLSDKGADWAVLVATSHNSYVDLALTIGLPGLVLMIIGFVALPLVDYHHTQRRGGNAVLAEFGLILWLFSIYLGSFEAIVFTRAEPAWFMLALSVCILRYARMFRVSS